MKLSRILMFAASAAALQACSHKADERPMLSVSIEPQRYLLEQIAGPAYRVNTLLENGANPETFDPAMSQRVAADHSAAYFAVGTLPFEESLRQSLGKDVRWVDTSEGIELLYGTHSHSHGEEHAEADEHEHSEADPHVWTSVANARRMAANMAGALAELNPDSAAVYAARLAALDGRLAALDANVRQRLEGAPTVFAVWHPSLSYFAADYGLEQQAVGSESKEMSPKRVREVIDHAKADSVRVFFFQQEYDSRQAESINAGIGSRLVVINPLSYDFEGQIKMIADELARP